ncbi:hypothetical protein CP556_01505 [Natrinema sp. CBA1119]|uniref:hypothetical protein n=1 Tax=Halobacteriales TaxID=2235 RepID=UPI000BF5048F|nr:MULTISPECIES: hypothetical protein [Halobacteria]PGF14931.1 hypothetical protein CP556_01505 [Natrinema sp. CBA1119]
MLSEKECCEDYIKQQSEAYEREVKVANALLRDTDHLMDAAAGAFAGSIDALYTQSDVGRERLVECKTSPTFRGLGQLILYTYFRRRDRELVRQQDNDNETNWETTKEIEKDETHLIEKGCGTERTVHAKPALEEIEQILAVCEVSPSDAPLLSAYLDLGMTVKHRTSGTWRELNADVVGVGSPDGTPPITGWIEGVSRDSLGSSTEEQLWEAVSGVFENERVFKEVPIGSHLYPDKQTSLRADVVVPVNDHWFVIEIKESMNDTAISDFQRAFGQAVGYASLFAREWDLPQNQVIPVVVQQPLALVGEVYRTDRYDDDDDVDMMASSAFSSMTEPLVLGDPQTFG